MHSFFGFLWVQSLGSTVLLARKPLRNLWSLLRYTRAHPVILAHTSRSGMRLLRQLPQLRQIVTRCSNGCATHLMVRSDANLCCLRAVEPVPQLTFTKSPLAADFDGGNLFAFRPKA